MTEIFAAKLLRFVRRNLGGNGSIDDLSRLSGGANMESWSFDYAGQGYVLRRAPSADLMVGRAYGHDIEAAVVRAAFAAGVRAPEIVAEIDSGDDLGTGYLMRRVDAEVNPTRILVDPPPSLLADLARELALIHNVSRDALPNLPVTTGESLLAELKSRFLAFGGDRPVMALALRWLNDQCPVAVDPVLLHGDFRMGNIMANARGLAVVLDWELAHLGDRHQDLAFGCINSWRFGHIDRPAFGLGQLDVFWAEYETASGVAVDPNRFRWWLIYATLWWGICCLQMADIWRNGRDTGLERAVIGRRTSETEVDLLLLLEIDAPAAERGSVMIPSTTAVRRTGEPSVFEMLEAIAGWIENEVKPMAQGRDRFMASVALNALGMLQRESQHQTTLYDKTLSDDLLAGRKSLATPGLLAQLKQQSLQKLRVDQPKYSALAKAIELWI